MRSPGLSLKIVAFSFVLLSLVFTHALAGCADPDASYPVVLWKDSNFRGTCARFSSTSRITGSLKDEASSVKIYPGRRVVLYDKDNYGGSSVTLTSNVANLKDYGFNDMAAFLHVQSDCFLGRDCWTILYEHDDYQGRCQCVLAGDTNLVNTWAQDEASSLKADAEHSARVYENVFSGANKELAGSIPDLDDYSLNDKITTLTVSYQGTCPARLYQHADFNGWFTCLRQTTPSLGDAGWGNDMLSSIKVPAGSEAVLYVDADFKGSSKQVKGPVSFANLKDYGFNDKVSSVSVVVCGDARCEGSESPSSCEKDCGASSCTPTLEYPLVLFEHADLAGRCARFSPGPNSLAGWWVYNEASSLSIYPGFAVKAFDKLYSGSSQELAGQIPRLDRYGLNDAVKSVIVLDRSSCPVQLFEHAFYKGCTQCFSSNSAITGCLENEASSVRLNGAGRVVLYDAGDYSGKSATVTGSIPDLSIFYGFGDRASSLFICGDCRTTAEFPVVGFEHEEYDGRCTRFSAGEHAYVGDDWNDLFTSVKIHEGYQAKLYQHADFQGDLVCLTESTSNLHEFNPDLDDKVSSLRIVQPTTMDAVILDYLPVLKFSESEWYFPVRYDFDGDLDISNNHLNYDELSGMDDSRQKPVVYTQSVFNEYNGKPYFTVQYWFYYTYNSAYGVHPDDWETVMVIFDYHEVNYPDSSQTILDPVGVAYAAHTGGNWEDWDDVPKAGDTHPVVKVALGSHASYPAFSGTKLLDKLAPLEICDGNGLSVGPAGQGTDYAWTVALLEEQAGFGDDLGFQRDPPWEDHLKTTNPPQWADDLRPAKIDNVNGWCYSYPPTTCYPAKDLQCTIRFDVRDEPFGLVSKAEIMVENINGQTTNLYQYSTSADITDTQARASIDACDFSGPAQEKIVVYSIVVTDVEEIRTYGPFEIRQGYTVFALNEWDQYDLDLHAYDTEGRHVGENETGGIDVEIPGASFYREAERGGNETIIVPSSIPVTLIVDGQQAEEELETYQLSIIKPGALGDSLTQTLEGSITSGSVQSFFIDAVDLSVKDLAPETIASGSQDIAQPAPDPAPYPVVRADSRASESGGWFISQPDPAPAVPSQPVPEQPLLPNDLTVPEERTDDPPVPAPADDDSVDVPMPFLQYEDAGSENSVRFEDNLFDLAAMLLAFLEFVLLAR